MITITNPKAIQTIQDKVEAEWKKKLQEMAYPLWEQNFEKKIQGMNDR